MIRQAHSYLVGAVSGTALVAMAVVAFVLLVSFQALRDWPLADIGGGDEAAVSSGQPVQGGPTTTGARTGATQGSAANGGGRQRDGRAGGRGGDAALGTSPSASTGVPAGEAPAATPGGGPGGAAQTGAPRSSGAGSGPSPSKGQSSGSGSSTSGTVTGTVNETVAGADKTLGGALSETGATEAVENAVTGVAGPGSAVGETIDKASEAVNGLSR
jgi:hypothetical protein